MRAAPRRARPPLLMLTIGLAVLGCAAGQSVSPTVASPSAAAHWTYTGEDGPENWGELSPDYEACASGRSQSPVDVADPEPTDLADITFVYRPAPLEIVNNGHTIQVNYAPGSYAELGGKRYELAQFHFHSPSEHTVNGKHAEMEVHLVHRDKDGKLAVVGVFLKPGHELAGLAATWKNLPKTEGEKPVAGASVDASSLLPKRAEVYTYSGSLTTPPCSEGVSWFVMVDPAEVSAEQIKVFQAIVSPNARPVQPLNSRGAMAAHR